MSKIVIIGGGIAGCTTAIALRENGHEVTILEKDADLLRGTSARTPGRMGLGYHYFDSSTARFYMENTIGFMKKYSDCFLGDEESSYLQNGRYFITKDSLVPLQELMATYDEISLQFESICREDSSNDIFGTGHLHRTMRTHEFQDDVAVDKVELAIETKELLLDWQKFDTRLRMELEASGVITKNNFEISSVKMASNGSFCLSNSAGETEEADYVINCTWQNIDKLNDTLGIGDARSRNEDKIRSTTSRLKLLAEVELPESLSKKHSMFFCVGPHAMFSNMGKGVGRITYAPVTNFGTTTENDMPEQFERWLSEGLTEEEEADYGSRIIEGVAEYIPAMRDARLLRVIPGIVKSKGSVDITDKDSPFHKRGYSGVEEQQIGWVDNAAMKLFYSLGNAQRVLEIISRQEIAIHEIGQISAGLLQSRIFGNGSPLPIFHVFENNLKRNFKAEDILSNPSRIFGGMQEAFIAKQQALLRIWPNNITRLRDYKALSPKSKSTSIDDI